MPGGLPEERPIPETSQQRVHHAEVYGSLFFAAAKNLEEMLPAVDQTTHAVVAIGLRGKSEIGSTFITVLQRYAQALQAHDSKLMLVGKSGRARSACQNRRAQDHRRGERVPRHTTARRRDEHAAEAAYAWLGRLPAGPVLGAARNEPNLPSVSRCPNKFGSPDSMPKG